MSFLQLCILVLGALGGRFDHEMGNINVLHIFPNINIILLSNDCLIFLLPRTHNHEIHVERSIEGPHCGLIPIGMPSTSTTTTGLQWNLGECRPYLAWCRFSNKNWALQCVSFVQTIPAWAMEDWSARQTSWKMTRWRSPRSLTLSGQYRSRTESAEYHYLYQCKVPILSRIFCTTEMYLITTRRKDNIFRCPWYCKPDRKLLYVIWWFWLRDIWLCARKKFNYV